MTYPGLNGHRPNDDTGRDWLANLPRLRGRGTTMWWRGRCSILNVADQALSDAVRVRQNIRGGNSDNSHALTSKISVPACVALWSILEVMGLSVDLKAKSARWAVEIEHVGTDRMLAAEHGLPGLPAPEMTPKQDFWQRH